LMLPLDLRPCRQLLASGKVRDEQSEAGRGAVFDLGSHGVIGFSSGSSPSEIAVCG
jgi:hypothetical protein